MTAIHEQQEKLWCDCETDQEKVDFLRSGRAVATGIIAPAIVEDVAKAFDAAVIHSGSKVKRCNVCGSDAIEPSGSCAVCLSCGASIGSCG